MKAQGAALALTVLLFCAACQQQEQRAPQADAAIETGLERSVEDVRAARAIADQDRPQSRDVGDIIDAAKSRDD
jgi:type II secretory pathway component PulM